MTFEHEFTSFLKNVIKNELKKEVPEITPSMSFQDLGIDSMDRIRIVIHVERAYGVEFSENEAGSIQTVGELIQFIEDKGGVQVDKY
ncbi:acyl carrier protein [Hazenella coriacea]|uniref:Acyl carrier protein n=1 Tax=Hazenella coriacea TaxID=1179467 RepID=A0A4R3LEC0_9BACL|nr:acyl carrier protein [Hazenella coriacea]TCS95796.1 acyl carrier protein [Hazenella coriacea]